MSETSYSRIGRDILSVFDVWEDSREFLIDIIEASKRSKEVETLLRQSLLAGAEDWNYLIDCARSIRQNQGINYASLDGQDVLSYIWYIFDGVEFPSSSNPWEKTDRLIAQARLLARGPEDCSPELFPQEFPSELSTSIPWTSEFETTESSSQQSLPRAQGHIATSHYWSDEPETPSTSQNYRLTNQAFYRKDIANDVRYHERQNPSSHSNLGVMSAPQSSQSFNAPSFTSETALRNLQVNSLANLLGSVGAAVGVKQATTSPYFTPPTSETRKSSPRKRPPPGTVSTVPFAPLTSPFFGIIQEEFAHDPFWLLIAVTFLIKTNGKLAIPTFYKVKERYPTPQHVADPENTEPLIDMIRHLGLSIVRVAFMQKYAKGFIEDPPRPGVRYKVNNYDKRDIDTSLRTAVADIANTASYPTPDGSEDELDAWEIGHLTKGKYAIDSWRIFCRDELLGRAQDWNGKGREPEFQPEWMRVRPSDKELRAYLRWMWMREGWEWDPVTGERTVLRDEMRSAVNEGRVEYDDTGGLRILDEPSSD